MNANNQSESKHRRRTPLGLAPLPRPDLVLPEGYSVEDITGVGYRVVVDVDAVPVDAC